MKAWVIAAPSSGSGKTSVTLGLARACVRRGLRVQCFKVGPDYLDPTYLARASRNACLNMDPWMAGEQHVRKQYEEAKAKNDVILIEGVMGLFDGASSVDLQGSTAEVARMLDLPVLLVVPAGGMARSLCAIVHGFNSFSPQVRIGGVIANFIGSDSHRTLLHDALCAANLPPLLGAIPKDALPSLPGRHLGLVDAAEVSEIDTLFNEMANSMEQFLDLHALVESPLPDIAIAGLAVQETVRVPRVRVGIASDAAFRFTYPDNLAALENAGVRWVPFSPLRDRALPSHLDAVYFPGGYPEVHAWTLSANRTFLDSVRTAIDEGLPIYAECGGLMYLTRGVTTQDGVFHSMVGALPTVARMLPKRKALGYTEIHTTADTHWGPVGTVLRGHEFHYSELEQDLLPGWDCVYNTSSRGLSRPEGYSRGRILASYVHLHWASRPEVCEHFVRTLLGET